MATTRLRVGCRVFCVDYHNPVVLAKETATLDMLSEGRVEVGLGAGWVAAEYEGLGIAMDRPGVRIERLAEAVEVLKAHWAGEPLDITRTYVRASGFAGRPRPVQQPHPPIFIGGGAPRVLQLAGRLADIVSINFNNAAGKLGAGSVASSTRDATVEKIGWIQEGAGDRFGDLELEIAAYFIAISDDPADAVAAMAQRFGVTPEVLAEHPHALIGSVPEICDKLERRRGELRRQLRQRGAALDGGVRAGRGPAGGQVTTIRSWCPARPGDRPRPADRRRSRRWRAACRVCGRAGDTGSPGRSSSGRLPGQPRRAYSVSRRSPTRCRRRCWRCRRRRSAG